MDKLRIRRLGELLILLVLVTLFCYWQNNALVITTQTYESSKVPAEISGLTIVHISDLHNKKFGSKQERLVEPIKAINPDLMVVTGDLVDSYQTDLDAAMLFIRQAKNIAPIYYVSGNHEARRNIYPELKRLLIAEGVIILDNEAVELEYQGKYINLLGLADPSFSTSFGQLPAEELQAAIIRNKGNEANVLNILLSHRPELLALYARSGLDLVFSGHAHGGQFRLPFVGGFVAPNQGVFPKLTSG